MSNPRYPELLDLPNELLQQIFYHTPLNTLFQRQTIARSFKENTDGFFIKGHIKPLELITFISNLNNPPAFEKFIEKFHQTISYKTLVKKNFDEMTNMEKICFALIRDSQELHKVDHKKLENAMNALQDNLPINILESIQITILAMKFSETTNANIKKQIQQQIRDKLINRHLPHAIVNLSGLNLNKLVLYSKVTDGVTLYPCLNMVNMGDAELEEANLSSCNLGGLTLAGAVIGMSFITSQNNSKEIMEKITQDNFVYLFSASMLKNIKLFNEALDKIWNSFKKGNNCSWSFGLYELITYLIEQQIRFSQLNCKSKIDLIDTVMNHPMFNISSTLELIKTNVNYAATLLKPDQYYTSYNTFFRSYIDFKPYTKKFDQLKSDLIEQLKIETEEETYIQSLHSLSL